MAVEAESGYKQELHRGIGFLGNLSITLSFLTPTASLFPIRHYDQQVSRWIDAHHAGRGTGAATRSSGESAVRSLRLVSGPHHTANAVISDSRMT